MVFFFRKGTSKGRLLLLTSKRYGKEGKEDMVFVFRKGRLLLTPTPTLLTPDLKGVGVSLVKRGPLSFFFGTVRKGPFFW